MTILVTGGAGFIGSNLVHSLNADGIYQITVCDQLISYQANKTENLKGARFELVKPPDLISWLNCYRPHVVIHLAGITDTRRHDAEVFSVNFCLSIDLFQWCTKHRVPFIYASSAATYGAGDYGFDDDMMRWLVPMNMYGWSKHVFDLWAFDKGREERPPVCVGLKLFNVYGPREAHKGVMASVITQKLYDMIAGRPQRLFKSHHTNIPDGMQLRDFVYVDDVCSVIKFFMKGNHSGIFNVGTGYPRSFRDAIVALGESLGKVPDIRYIDMPHDIRTQYQYRTQAELGKLRRVGYDKPFISLEEGIQRTVEFFRQREIESAA